MAKYDDRKNAALAVALRRQSSSPLDVSSVFNSIADFEAYVKQNTNYGPYSDAKENSFLQKINPYSYAGQVVTVLDAATGTAKTFVINKAGPLGTGTIDTNVERVDGAVGPHIRYNNGEANIDLAADTWYYSAFNKKYFKFGADGAYQITETSPGSEYKAANAIPETVTEFQTTIGGKLQKFEFTEDIKARYTEVGSVPAVDGKSIKAVDVVTADGKTVKTLEISSTTSTLADIDSKKGTDDAYAAGTTFQLTLDLNGNVRWVKVDTQTMEGVASTLQTYGNQISEHSNQISNHTAQIGLITNDINTIKNITIPNVVNNSIRPIQNTIDNTILPTLNDHENRITEIEEFHTNYSDIIIELPEYQKHIANSFNGVWQGINSSENSIRADMNHIGNSVSNISNYIDNSLRKIEIPALEANIDTALNNTWDLYNRINTVSGDYVKSVEYNKSTGVFDFAYVQNNTAKTLNIDLALERVVTNFFYTANGETPDGKKVYQYTSNKAIGIGASIPSGASAVKNSLVLELTDAGDESNEEVYQAVSLEKFVDIYTGVETDTVKVDVSADNKISANIVANAIRANNAETIIQNDAFTSAVIGHVVQNNAITTSIISDKVADNTIVEAVLLNKIAGNAITSSVLAQKLENGAVPESILIDKVVNDAITTNVLTQKVANDAVIESVILNKVANVAITTNVLTQKVANDAITTAVLGQKVANDAIITTLLSQKVANNAINTNILSTKIGAGSVTNAVLGKIVANDAIDSSVLINKIKDSAVTTDVLNTIIANGAITTTILGDKIVEKAITVGLLDRMLANDSITGDILVEKLANDSLGSYLSSKVANNAIDSTFLEKTIADNSISSYLLNSAIQANAIDQFTLDKIVASKAITSAFITGKVEANIINDQAIEHLISDNTIDGDALLDKIAAGTITNSSLQYAIGNSTLDSMFLGSKIDEGAITTEVAEKIFADGAYLGNVSVEYANFADYADTAGTAASANNANFADKVRYNAIFGYNDANGNFVETERYDGSSEVTVTIEDLGGLTTANHTTMEVFVSGNDASIVSDTGITTNDGEFLKDRKLTIEAGNFITLTTIDDEEDPAHKRLKIDADAVHRSFTWQNTNGNAIAMVPEDDNCNIIFKEGDGVKFDVVSSYNHNANTTYPHNNPGSYTFQINARDTLAFGALDAGPFKHEGDIPKAIATYVMAWTETGDKLLPIDRAEANWAGRQDGRDLYLDVVENGITTKHIADEAITSNKIYEVDAGKITSNNSVRLVLNCGGAKRA